MGDYSSSDRRAENVTKVSDRRWGVKHNIYNAKVNFLPRDLGVAGIFAGNRMTLIPCGGQWRGRVCRGHRPGEI